MAKSVRECNFTIFCVFLDLSCFFLIAFLLLLLIRVHYSKTHEGQEPSESHYQLSAYSAMENPLKAGLLLWQLSHM